MVATALIFAAGIYKLPDLVGALGNGIRGRVVVGSIGAYLAIRFFHTLTPSPSTAPSPVSASITAFA